MISVYFYKFAMPFNDFSIKETIKIHTKMKKLFTLITIALVAINALAQDYFNYNLPSEKKTYVLANMKSYSPSEQYWNKRVIDRYFMSVEDASQDNELRLEARYPYHIEYFKEPIYTYASKKVTMKGIALYKYNTGNVDERGNKIWVSHGEESANYIKSLKITTPHSTIAQCASQQAKATTAETIAMEKLMT